MPLDDVTPSELGQQASPPYTFRAAPEDQQPAFAVPRDKPDQPETWGTVGIVGTPWEHDPQFQKAVEENIYSCPSSPAGDYSFFAWLYDFCVAYKGGPPPAELPLAPVITSLLPDSTPADADVTLAIVGTGFVTGASVKVGVNSVTPSSVTATDISVSIPAADISIAGSVPISVENPDLQVSNEVTLTLS